MSVRRSLILSFAQRYTAIMLQFGASMILSRLLTPLEIGVFSVCAFIVQLAHTLRDFGVGDFLIQERELTRDKIRSAFFVSVVIAWTLAGGLMCLSSLLGWLCEMHVGSLKRICEEPGVTRVLPLLAINFLLLPFGSPAFALLNREMAFGRIYIIQTTAIVTQVSVSIVLAWLGFSYMSLAWASIASTVATVVLASVFRPRDTWVWPGVSQVRHVLRFGVMASACSLLHEANHHAQEFVLSPLLGFRANGLFSRSAGLIENFHMGVTSAIMRVVMPAFAKAHHGGESLKDHYARVTSLFTAVAWPFFGVVICLAAPIIRVLFGDQWVDTIPVTQILAAGAMVYALWAFAPQVLVAAGNIRSRVVVQAIAFPVQIVLIAFGAYHGLAWVAIAMNVTGVLMLALYHRAVHQAFGFGWRDLVRACRPSITLTLGSVALPALVALSREVLGLPLLIELILGGIGATIGWVGTVYLTRHPLRAEIERAFGAVRARFARPAGT